MNGGWAGGSARDPMAPPPEGPRYLSVRVAALWLLLIGGFIAGVVCGPAVRRMLQ